MDTCLLVFTTCPDKEVAQKISYHLVEKKLAACINILPGVESIYQWQGKIEQDHEVVLLIKTTNKLYNNLEREIERVHPYELPEIIAVSIEQGHDTYLQWIIGSTTH